MRRAKTIHPLARNIFVYESGRRDLRIQSCFRNGATAATRPSAEGRAPRGITTGRSIVDTRSPRYHTRAPRRRSVKRDCCVDRSPYLFALILITSRGTNIFSRRPRLTADHLVRLIPATKESLLMRRPLSGTVFRLRDEYFAQRLFGTRSNRALRRRNER